jgi:hypothetical protein
MKMGAKNKNIVAMKEVEGPCNATSNASGAEDNIATRKKYWIALRLSMLTPNDQAQRRRH